MVIFLLSNYIYLIVILFSVFGLFIFGRFNDYYYLCTYGTYTCPDMYTCPSHVFISFLNTSNVSADLILTGREFQIFGPRKARLFVLKSGRGTTRLFWCCVRFDLKVSDLLKRFFIQLGFGQLLFYVFLHEGIKSLKKHFRQNFCNRQISLVFALSQFY